ncbi:MAG: DEAD/DEAH box helicase family protein [bacterium]
MSIQSLKSFQEDAVKSGVELFAQAKVLLDAAGTNLADRAKVVNHNGYLLIEAPTGSGKTLMAGTIVERLSHLEDVVWFWFAPFKGVVGQSEAFLREQFHGLRLRELTDDRAVAGSRRGDVFITTWQTVATRVKDKRNVRKESDNNPSVDTLIEALRDQGLRIGVVVDEAHHGFGKDTLAAKFFREVLKPEYTILITATPDDTDVKDFEKALEIAELQRIRVSRTDAVDAGLIKSGVKCAAYFVEPEKRSLVDLQGTALRDGVAAHRGLKKLLSDIKVPLVPLLLVQADSTEKSVDALKDKLIRLGFTAEQIAVHTADEPDAGLLALANDERREVLIFKMAVALGFDAPRAFTLVSMRASRDPDFGVQLVGRILRVHRLLHARARAKSLPAPLNYGYVFLSDAETQTGLDIAGQKINQIQTEYAKASTATVAYRIGDATAIASVAPNGQTSFNLASAPAPLCYTDAPVAEVGTSTLQPTDFNFSGFFGDMHQPDEPEPYQTSRLVTVAGPVAVHRYALRPDMPRRFKTQEVSPDNDVTEEDCANRMMIPVRALFDALKNKIAVEKRTLDVFCHTFQKEFNFAADLSPDQAARTASALLQRNKVFDCRELRKALLQKMQMVMCEETMDGADDPVRIAAFLDVILASSPEILVEAQKAALAQTKQIRETGDLPSEIASDEPLPIAMRNVYGIVPSGLNTWERAFVDVLERDMTGAIKWWHRNEPHKPWAVNVLMPDGRGFYPDFVIGVEGRKTEDNVLLADPKLNYQRDDEAPKVLAKHQVYGRVLILFRDGARWMTVGWDDKTHKPCIVNEFRLSNAAGF